MIKLIINCYDPRLVRSDRRVMATEKGHVPIPHTRELDIRAQVVSSR